MPFYKKILLKVETLFVLVNHFFKNDCIGLYRSNEYYRFSRVVSWHYEDFYVISDVMSVQCKNYITCKT